MLMAPGCWASEEVSFLCLFSTFVPAPPFHRVLTGDAGDGGRLLHRKPPACRAAAGPGGREGRGAVRFSAQLQAAQGWAGMGRGPGRLSGI